MSRNVTEIYIAQWVIIGYLAPQIFKMAALCIIVAVYKSFRRRLAR